MKHRVDIDGLRALAVLPVVFYHVGWGFPGGFVGVDIFFVISGFLISGILLRELERGRFSLLEFYDRRIRRILPALSFMLVGVLAAVWWLFLPYETEQLGKHLTQVAAFLSNYWLKAKAGDYWSARAEELPLLHTWSLAVEEQFYIFMPILLWVLFRFCKQWLAPVLSGLCLISLAYGIQTTNADPASAFYLLPSRAWEMLLGALVFLACRKERAIGPALLQEGLSLLGLGLVIGSFFLINGDMAFPGVAALAPTLGAALLIYANATRLTLSGRLLCWKPFQWIGLISYSLYLWHWPAIVFAKSYRYPDSLSVVDQCWIITGSIAVAAFSWWYVEQPFRTKRFAQMPRRVVLAGCAILMFFVGLSLVIRKTDGYPPRFESRVPEALYNMISSDVLDKAGSNRFQAGPRFAHGGLQENIEVGDTPEMVLIGDSHGAMLAPVISELCKQTGTGVAFFTHDGKTPFFGQNEADNDQIGAQVTNWSPETILIVLRWDDLWEGVELKNEEAHIQLEAVAEKLNWLASQTKQLFVSLQIPRISDENMRAAKILYNRSLRNGQQLPIIKEAAIEAAYRKKTEEFLNQLQIQNLSIIDPSQAFLTEGVIQYHDNGLLFYRDDDHLNLRGAQKAESLFMNAMTLK